MERSAGLEVCCRDSQKASDSVNHRLPDQILKPFWKDDQLDSKDSER